MGLAAQCTHSTQPGALCLAGLGDMGAGFNRMFCGALKRCLPRFPAQASPHPRHCPERASQTLSPPEWLLGTWVTLGLPWGSACGRPAHGHQASVTFLAPPLVLLSVMSWSVCPRVGEGPSCPAVLGSAWQGKTAACRFPRHLHPPPTPSPPPTAAQ